MSHDHARTLQLALEQAGAAVIAATAEIALMPAGEERTTRLRALATLLVGSHEALRAQAMRLCPDLASTEAVPDGQLHPTELEGVSRLKDVDIVTIDGALLANSTASWQRASRVIGHALVTLNNQFANVAFGFYAQRVAALVQDGRLQAQGDLAFMRLCEVRLSAPAEGAA